MHILFVEDDMLAREALKSFLSPLCDTLDFAANGEEAYDLFQKQTPDILVTDLSMPIMDGFTLIENITKTNRKPYIIIVSALHSPEHVKRAESLGVNVFLPKPLDLDMLEANIRRFTSNGLSS